jgi:hypothetical protein
MSNAKVLEQCFPVLGATITDINASAITGDYINLAKYGRVLVCVAMADGDATTGDVHVLLYQASDSSGTDAAVLNCLQTGRIYTRYAADYATVAALTTSWTKATQATADEEYADATSGEACGFICLEVRASDLTDGMDYIRADIQASTSSKYVCLFYLPLDPAFASDPTTQAVPTV